MLIQWEKKKKRYHHAATAQCDAPILNCADHIFLGLLSPCEFHRVTEAGSIFENPSSETFFYINKGKGVSKSKGPKIKGAKINWSKI